MPLTKAKNSSNAGLFSVKFRKYSNQHRELGDEEAICYSLIFDPFNSVIG